MKKLLISLVLIFFITISSLKAYAYYEDSDTSYISDAKPQELLSQKLVTENGKHLVPTGAILGVDDVEEVVYVYRLFVQNGLVLNLDTTNVLFNGEELSEMEDLFNFSYTTKEINKDTLHTSLFEGSEEGTFIEVTLTVSMNQPTYEEYQEVANKVLTFDVLFQSN